MITVSFLDMAAMLFLYYPLRCNNSLCILFIIFFFFYKQGATVP